MKFKKIILIAVLFVILILGVFLFSGKKEMYRVDGNTLFYSKDRGNAVFEKYLLEKNNSFEIYKIRFQSRNFLDYKTLIYGLLFLPKTCKNTPGIVYLPGGGVQKENLRKRALRIVNLGYAVFVIDQRGIGETGGAYLNPIQDYQIFKKGKEPIQHLSVYDGLRAFDVLKNISCVGDVGIVGESMGGRYAIIAGAIDDRIKGVVVISSSGFHIKESKNSENDYFVSIDPDHYVSKISPRPFFMLQGDNDSVTHLEDAEFTFGIAKKPKRIFIAKGCEHGFCEKMWPEFREDLKKMFSS